MSAANRRGEGILGLAIESISPCMNLGVSGVPPAGKCRFSKHKYTDPESWQNVFFPSLLWWCLPFPSLALFPLIPL